MTGAAPKLEPRKDCPCCGSSDVKSYFLTGEAFHYVVRCDSCGLTIQRHGSSDPSAAPWRNDPKQHAVVIAAWNRRDGAPAPAKPLPRVYTGDATFHCHGDRETCHGLFGACVTARRCRLDVAPATVR